MQKYLKTYEFITYVSDSDGIPVEGTKQEHILLFNSSQISDKEVLQLIDNGNWEYDNRVVKLNRAQLEFLKDKEEQ